MASKKTKRDSFSGYLPEWLDLPEGLVCLIVDELLELIDFVRFAAVCKKWHSLAKHYYLTTQRWRRNQVLPMLLIPCGFKEVDTTTTKAKMLPFSLYSVSEKRVYMNNFDSPLVPYGTKRLVGCSHGWLATLDEQPRIVALVNPFRKSVAPILLPPLKDGCYLDKVILSADPALDANSCVVVAKFYENKHLASMKLRKRQDHEKQRWTYIRAHRAPSDVILYKSRLCICHPDGSIVSTSYQRAEQPEVVTMILGLFTGNSYLVESATGDHLWHVRRYFVSKKKLGVTESFKVFKVMFNDTGGRLQQVEVKSIGEEALFLGYTNSFSVLASEISGCQPNSIYYEHNHVMGIFNLDNETSTTQNHSPLYRSGDEQPAIWITPPLNELLFSKALDL